jgi:HlyD family secretion protein
VPDTVGYYEAGKPLQAAHMKKLIPIVIVAGATLAAFTYLPSRFRKQPIRNELRVSGNIEVHESDLSFKVQGRVKELPVQEGQWVEAGTMLARLDDDDYRQQVMTDEANMNLRHAQLGLTEAGSRTQDIKATEQSMLDAQADLELKKIDLKRKEELYKKDAISAETRDIAATNLKRAQAMYERSKQLYEEMKEGSRREQIVVDRQTVAQAFQNLRLSRIKLGYTVLRAPSAGVIVTREAELGEVVSPGTPIVTLADLDHVWLRAYVSETDLGRVHWGQPATITTDTYPGKSYQGKLSFIASDAEFTPKSVQTQNERVTLVYKIKIDLPNPNHELKPGMPADAVLSLSPQAAANSAPKIVSQDILQRAPPQPADTEQIVDVRSVEVNKRRDSIEIRINGSAPIRHESMMLKNPDRVVLDLPYAKWNHAPRLIPVKTVDVKAVRISLRQIDPPLTRLVVDLAEARDYEVVALGNDVRVKLSPPSANNSQRTNDAKPSQRSAR